jgi:hypothetical protein
MKKKHQPIGKIIEVYENNTALIEITDDDFIKEMLNKHPDKITFLPKEFLKLPTPITKRNNSQLEDMGLALNEEGQTF